MASSAVGQGTGSPASLNNRGGIRLTKPNGQILTTISLGRIGTNGNSTDVRDANRAAELAGPVLPDQTPSGAQYTPWAYQVTLADLATGETEGGVFMVEFIPPAGATNSGSSDNREDTGNFLADGGWIQNNNGNRNIAAWDVSVSNTGNTGWISGRVYTNVLAMNINTNQSSAFINGRGFYGTFKVLTVDGYVYNVGNNGNNGISFTFFSNSNGIREGTNGIPTYKSFNSSEPANLVGKVHDPRMPDDLGNSSIPDGARYDVTHKIFYTTPAADLPESARGAVPGSTGTYAAGTWQAGTSWLKVEPKVPLITDVRIVGAEGNIGNMSSKGGEIRFHSSQAGNYNILIESGETAGQPGYFEAFTLVGIAVEGENVVAWDGRDSNGDPIPQGTSPARVEVQLYGAEVHFPFFDMEVNPNGTIIELLNANGTVRHDIVYWDDSDISPSNQTGSQGPVSNPINASHIVYPSGHHSNSSNPPPSTAPNGHRWGQSTGSTTGTFGDEKSMDTWSFIQGALDDASANFGVRKIDLDVVSVTPSKASAIIGETIDFTVEVRNISNNTDDAVGATFGFYLPEGMEMTATNIEAVGFTGINGASIDASTAQYNPATRLYTIQVDLPADNNITGTFTIPATVAAGASYGAVVSHATLLRPADVEDLDATNFQTGTGGAVIPPTDPFFECQGANRPPNQGPYDPDTQTPSPAPCNNIRTTSITILQTVQLSGSVLNDNDGTIGGVDGPGVSGVTVTLYEADGTTVFATTATDVNGAYSFNAIASSTYVVEVTLPTGFFHVSSTDETPTNGMTTVTTETVDRTGVNFGINEPPVANDDTVTDQIPATAAVIPTIASNDTDPNNGPAIAPATINLLAPTVPSGSVASNPDANGNYKTVTVPGEGVWTVDESGNVTFSPYPGFLTNPTPITYTVRDAARLLSNAATLSIGYLPAANLSIMKSISDPEPYVGDVVTFTITIANTVGPGTATNITVTDVVPSGYTIGAIHNDGTNNSGTITWSIASLALGQSATVSFEATVLATGEHNNTATVEADEHDPDENNNENTLPVTVCLAGRDQVPLTGSKVSNQ